MSLFQEAEAMQTQAVHIVFPKHIPEEYTIPSSYRDLCPESKDQLPPDLVQEFDLLSSEREELKEFNVKAVLVAQNGWLHSICARCKEKETLLATPEMMLKLKHKCGGILLQCDAALAILYSSGSL